MGTGALALPLRGTVRYEKKRDQRKRDCINLAALQEEELKVKVAWHSSELTEKMNRPLRNVNAELQEKYNASVGAYNALKSDFNTLVIQSKAKVEGTLKNACGAGRKAALSKEEV